MPLRFAPLWLLLLVPPMASAAPPRAGGELAVNSYTSGNQYFSDVAADGAGRFVIVWEATGQDGQQSGIFGQRFTAAGTPAGSEFQVNVFTTSHQLAPRVAARAAGGFVVVWTSGAGQDGAGNGVFGRAYDAAGNALGGEFRVNAYTTSNQSMPAVSVDPAGDVVVVWASDGPDGSGLGIRGRRFNASGTALGDEFPVNTFTTSTQSAPAVATHADGSFVVTWTSFFQDGSAEAVIGRRFNASGTPLGGEFQVNTHTPQAQDAPQVAALGGGAFAVVWRSQQDGNVHGVVARRFDTLGNPAGSEFVVNTFTTDAQQFPDIAADPSGGFTIVWESWTQDGSQAGIFGRSFDAAGTAAEVEFVVNAYTPYSQRVPVVAADAHGRFVVAWHDEVQDGHGWGVRAQRFGDLIFADGVESGGFSAWSSNATDAGDLSVHGTAALAGSTAGLRGVVDDVNGLFVQDDSPTDEPRYRARFYIDPNGFDPGETQLHRRTRTFIAFSEAPTRRVAAVVLRRLNGVFSLMARASLDDDRRADTGFFTISDGPHAVEIELVRASGPDALDGTLELWIDGVSMVQLTGLDNSRSEVDFARLGALSVKAGANGTIYWDEFESRRLSPIGLLP